MYFHVIHCQWVNSSKTSVYGAFRGFSGRLLGVWHGLTKPLLYQLSYFGKPKYPSAFQPIVYIINLFTIPVSFHTMPQKPMILFLCITQRALGSLAEPASVQAYNRVGEYSKTRPVCQALCRRGGSNGKNTLCHLRLAIRTVSSVTTMKRISASVAPCAHWFRMKSTVSHVPLMTGLPTIGRMDFCT